MNANLSRFLKDTKNKWVKIDENEGFTIIQKVETYDLVEGKSYFECHGKSYSNYGGVVVEYDDFYMTKELLNGPIHNLTDEQAEIEIKKMKGEV